MKKLSLDTAAKTAEVIAAVSVIVGLFVVVLEIRQNTAAQEFHATQTLVSEYLEATRSINDPEFVCVYARGARDFDALSQAEKIRYSIQMQGILRTFEQLHYASLEGTIDPEVHEGFRQQITSIMQLPGNQRYWSMRRSWFGSGFSDVVDNMIAEGSPEQAAQFEYEECG